MLQPWLQPWLREDNERTRYLSPAEEARLLAACTGERKHLRGMIILSVNLGLRRGDLFALRWSDVDFEQGRIRVRNHKAGARKSFDLPLVEAVRDELLKLKAEAAGDYVFTNPETGKPYRDIKRAFLSACIEAKIPHGRDTQNGVVWHDLRHTALTRLGAAGADAFTIAAIAGHSSIQMTRRYVHVQDERKRQFLEAISGRTPAVGHNLVTKERRRTG